MFFNHIRGGMLTGSEILRQIKKGNISIDPFDPNKVNPNSYNVTLNKRLKVYSRNDPTDRKNIIPANKIKSASIITHADENTNKTIASKVIVYDNVQPAISNHIDRYEDIPLIRSNFLDPLDSKKENEYIEFIIPEEGYVLQPSVLYIGSTNEYTCSEKFIPMINGRSSIGRLGISVHVTAGFGDIGFCGTWTLEITAVEPVRIYPNMEIAQIAFHTPYGKTNMKYNGKYQWQVEPTTSRMNYDFINNGE